MIGFLWDYIKIHFKFLSFCRSERQKECDVKFLNFVSSQLLSVSHPCSITLLSAYK